MFRNNQILTELKEKIHSQKLRVEGFVRGTEKNFGFLEVNNKKKFFIPPIHMKKVMHGDKIIAIIHNYKNRLFIEPEKLIKPFLKNFIGYIQKKDNNKLFVIPKYPLLKYIIHCHPTNNIIQELKQNDWVIAKMRYHPLKDKQKFYADIIEYITNDKDEFAQLLVTLRRYKLEHHEPKIIIEKMNDKNIKRIDLTNLHFITIDNAKTEDMDDALYIEKTKNGEFKLFIAIADPTSYIQEGSELDKIAMIRSCTNYLHGFNIPMLPRKLSDDLCSLQPNECRQALVCITIIKKDKTIDSKITFFNAWIKSKTKLIYDEVSDWLENTGTWKPSNDIDKQQILLLKEMADNRFKWRKENALVFKDKPEYRFILNEQGDVINIITKLRRSSNRIVEEAMITANLCAASILKEKLGFGIFSVHVGFEPLKIEQVVNILKTYGIKTTVSSLLTIKGFRELHNQLNTQPTQLLYNRIRSYQTITRIKIKPGPHFGLGVDSYATWTSPIRKYTDIINHRLLKSIITGKIITNKPTEKLAKTLDERRRANRMAEKEVNNWLYAKFLKSFINTNTKFLAELIDVNKHGIKTRLINNGAITFIPSSFMHKIPNEIICNSETGCVLIKGKQVYQLNDIIDVIIVEVNTKTTNIISRPV